MKKYQFFFVYFSENFLFLEVKFSIYLNRRVFVMIPSDCAPKDDSNQRQHSRRLIRVFIVRMKKLSIIIYSK